MSENTVGGSGDRGVRMTGLQYEALCRHAISRIYGVPVGEIHGGHLMGVTNRRQKTRHQIDLYWDTSDGVLAYRVFANAKWRVQNLDLEDMMHTIGVWRDIGVHKAVLITNTGFDIGVRKQAMEKGIGLLIVRPCVDFGGLGRTKVEVVVGEVERIAAERAEPVFGFEMVHKGFMGERESGGGGEGARLGDARAGEEVSSGTGEGDGIRGEGGVARESGGGEGVEEQGGMWLIGGGSEGEVEGVENKALGAGQIRNKMM